MNKNKTKNNVDHQRTLLFYYGKKAKKHSSENSRVFFYSKHDFYSLLTKLFLNGSRVFFALVPAISMNITCRMVNH